MLQPSSQPRQFPHRQQPPPLQRPLPLKLSFQLLLEERAFHHCHRRRPSIVRLEQRRGGRRRGVPMQLQQPQLSSQQLPRQQPQPPPQWPLPLKPA